MNNVIEYDKILLIYYSKFKSNFKFVWKQKCLKTFY